MENKSDAYPEDLPVVITHMARSANPVVEQLTKQSKPHGELDYRDKKQVQLDVARVALSKAASAKLEKRVASVLAANPPLNYYQGFHDIAMHTHSTKQLENLALQQLRDFMAADLQPTMQLLKLVPELISACDGSGVGKYFIKASAVSSSNSNASRRLSGYFALAPIVTLFSHDCEDAQVISPVIRTVLKEGLSYAFYLYVALVVENGPQLLNKIGASTDDDEIDMAFQGLANTLDRGNYAALDRKARRLRSRYPLTMMPSFKDVSRFSVLKSGKITKRSTALYMLAQLERSSKVSRVPGLHISSMVAMAVGAVAVGMLWRLRK